MVLYLFSSQISRYFSQKSPPHLVFCKKNVATRRAVVRILKVPVRKKIVVWEAFQKPENPIFYKLAPQNVPAQPALTTALFIYLIIKLMQKISNHVMITQSCEYLSKILQVLHNIHSILGFWIIILHNSSGPHFTQFYTLEISNVYLGGCMTTSKDKINVF